MTTLEAAPTIQKPYVSTKVRLQRFGAGVLPFVVLLIAWQLVYQFGLVPANWLPGPTAVAQAGAELIADGRYVNHIAASLGRVAIAFVVSCVLGIALGIVLGLSRGLAEFVEPLASFMNALSGIAWIPLAITWFGLGPVAVTFILWNTIFFLILFNTLVGIKSVPKIFESAVRTLGGGRRHVILQVLLPGALPNIVTGMRMGMGFGWRALIAAEMIAVNSGLGFMIFDASYYFRSDVIILGILTIGVIWLVTDRLLLVPLEKWTIERWGLISTMQ